MCKIFHFSIASFEEKENNSHFNTDGVFGRAILFQKLYLFLSVFVSFLLSVR